MIIFVTQHPWAALTIFAALLFIVTVIAVEIAWSRRAATFERMFERALRHGESFDGVVNALRQEREKDRKVIDENVLPVLAKLQEDSIDHGRRLNLLEARPSWALSRGPEGE